MKKTIVALFILLFNVSNVNAQEKCVAPNKMNYFEIIIATAIQKIDIQNKLMNQYCYDTKSEMFPKILESNTGKEGIENIQKRYTVNINSIKIWPNNRDLFSTVLLEKNLNAIYNDLEFAKEINEKDFIVQANVVNNPEVLLNLLQEVKKISKNDLSYMINKSKKDYLNYLSIEYGKEINIIKDDQGNTALMYVIVNNNPEYIENSLGRLRDKSLFIKNNNNSINPILAMFSQNLKGKNTDKLSEEMLKLVPTSYLINTSFFGYDFFQIAEAFEKNNPTYYQMLKKKYKFETKVKIPTNEIEKISKILIIP